MKFSPSGRAGWLKAGLRMSALLLLFGGGVMGAAWYVTAAPGLSYRGALPPPSAEHQAAAGRLKAHVTHLAHTIGARDVTHPKQLAAAEAYLTEQLKAVGYAPTRQPYAVGAVVVANVMAELKGSARPDEIVVVGAHYDCVETTPGADDNASGTAALIELARRLKGQRLARTVRFVGFVNEEPPYFKTEQMGSLVNARAAARAKENVTAMISLEMLGYYDPRAGAQKYPPPMGSFYPDTADFVAFVGSFEARPLVQRAVGTFRANAQFPSEAIAAPALIEGVDFSDHWSFWQAGYPNAIMVTDTAFFRNAHYHEGTDTPDRLDYDRMSRVTEGLVHVVVDLAGGD